MKKEILSKFWKAFLHWEGWKACGRFWGRVWRSTVCWGGWRCLFPLPFAVVLILSIACAGGLVWVFSRDLSMWTPAYALYAASAYCLAALCVKAPAGIRGIRAWIAGHPKVSSFFGNRELRFRLRLYLDQLLNFSYGMFKIASGVIYGSAWIGCDGIYNLTQAMIQLFQILRRKHAGSLEQQWRSYRFCGVLVLLMHLTLTGIVFQMINWNRATEQGEILVITTAFFAFYKITSSFVSIVKDRKHVHPVDSSVRMLNLAQAVFAIFSLQASMFHTFGTGESWEHLMNVLTGCTVCLLIVSMGIYMICRGNRELRHLRNANN